MKKLICLCIFLSGCAYNSITITADNGSEVKCTGTVDKPVTLERLVDAEGNTVPVGGI